MTNITREHIEEIRGYLKDTVMDDSMCNSTSWLIADDILDLALRALDNTSAKPSQSIVEAVAAAWASIDGHSDDFMRGKDASDISAFGGRYAGYMKDADELLKRSGIVEEIEAKAYEQVANFHSQVSINLRRNGKLELAEDLELFARTLRNVNLLTTRYVELPDGHVVVPVEAQPSHIKIIEDFIGDYTDRPIHGAARLYSAMIGEVK